MAEMVIMANMAIFAIFSNKCHNGHYGHNNQNLYYSPIWMSKEASGLKESSPTLQNHFFFKFKDENEKKL